MSDGTNNFNAERLWAALDSRRSRLLSAHLKKLMRSLQVYFPSFPDRKFAAHEWYFRNTRWLFKKDFAGLYSFSQSWRGKLLLDIGANRGQSIVAFQNVVPECNIVAFEANERLATRLVERYMNDAKVSIEACALTSAVGSLKLYIPSYNGFLFDGLASIDRTQAAGWLSKERLYWFDSRKVSVEESEVPARTLDSYGLAPVFMKLSIQRAELEMLRGASETLAMHRPVILCAYPWPALTEYLAEHDYRPYAYMKGRFVPDRLGLEFTWFLRQEHYAFICANA
jgi:FkbM family methyltransferase